MARRRRNRVRKACYVSSSLAGGQPVLSRPLEPNFYLDQLLRRDIVDAVANHGHRRWTPGAPRLARKEYSLVGHAFICSAFRFTAPGIANTLSVTRVAKQLQVVSAENDCVPDGRFHLQARCCLRRRAAHLSQ